MGICYEMKWLLRKPYLWFRNKITRQLQEQIRTLKSEIGQLEQQNHLRRQEMECEMHAMEEAFQCRIDQLIQNEKRVQEQNEKKNVQMRQQLGAVARQVMLTKWQVADLTAQESGADVLTCKICGYSQRRELYETKETDCIFYGGHLVRYVCPKCGVIFGPTKFSDLGQKKIDEDYKVHYLGFAEGDSSDKERKAFFMLHPTKEGIYLNYGCGHWSDSLQYLREQGYQVYGYEPYAPDMENPYMITDKKILSKMRFDGIYSNDVLEHLLDPVVELTFMRSLLLGADAKMAHSTSCYIYKHEHTRFHTHFFTGNAVAVLCEKSGLRVVDMCNEIETHDFICYVFAPVKDAQKMLKDMYIKENGKRDEKGAVLLYKNGILYGPYLHLAKRAYCLFIDMQGEALLRITVNCGREQLQECSLHTGTNEIRFTLSEFQKEVEFVVENQNDFAVIEDIRLS